MCGRYVLYEIEPLKEMFEIPGELTYEPNYNAAPTQTMPVITENGLEMMRWGIIPVWAKDEKVGYKLFNTRSETVFEKPMWKGIVTKRRCLVPANGFYEWQQRSSGKQPFYIRTKDQELFMFAGIWETWKHEGKEINTYSIMTTSPNEEMEPIHDRMPVILKKDEIDDWLGADDPENIQSLLAPYPDGELEMFEVSKDVNIVKNNDGRLITPLNSA